MQLHSMTSPGQVASNCRLQHAPRPCRSTRLRVSAATSRSIDVDVAIVGGGPAGLATARALRAVLSPNVVLQVFESRPDNEHGGAAVGLSINGLRALEAIHPSLAHRIYGHGMCCSSLQYRDEHTGELIPGKPVDTLSVAKTMAELDQHGHTATMVWWQEIVKELQKELPEDMVTYGCKLQEAEELPLGVEGGNGDEAASGGGGQHSGTATPQPGAPSIASNSSGSSGALEEVPYRYQLRFSCGGGEGGQQQQTDGAGDGLGVRAKFVIGADGYYSRVRRMLGDGAKPNFSEAVAWWGSLTEQQAAEGGVDTWPGGLDAELEGGSWRTCHAGPGRVLLMQRNVGKEVIWYLRAGVEDLRAAGLEYPCRSSGSIALGRALRTFSHLPAPVRRVLAATPPARVTERGLHMHDFGAMGQGSWVRGGVCLVGDAAHCGRPDGQGANLALEDAAELAARVREHGLGEQAFHAFESARMQRAKDILTDVPPFAVRTPLVLSASFAPLWSPADLPVPVGSVEEGLAWSRGVVRETVEHKLKAVVIAPQLQAA